MGITIAAWGLQLLVGFVRMIAFSTIIFSVYLAAVLQYLTSEILELAGGVAHLCQKKRISPRHLLMAAQGKEESVFHLNSMYRTYGRFQIENALGRCHFFGSRFLALCFILVSIFSLYIFSLLFLNT